MDDLTEIRRLLEKVFPMTEEVKVWLNTPHHRLGFLAPSTAMAEGQTANVRRILEEMAQ